MHMFARAIVPPSTVNIVPVIHSFVAKNNVACAISSTVPSRPMGMYGFHISDTPPRSNMASTGTTPGATAFTRYCQERSLMPGHQPHKSGGYVRTMDDCRAENS
jgi:hypothetical protein